MEIAKNEKHLYDLGKRAGVLLSVYWFLIGEKISLPEQKSCFTFHCSCSKEHVINTEMFDACACGLEHTFEMQRDPSTHRVVPGQFLYKEGDDHLILCIGKGWNFDCEGQKAFDCLSYIDEDEPKKIKFFHGIESIEKLGKGYKLF